MKVTTGIFLDKRRSLSDDTFPVKLRVTYNRKSKLYKTDFSFSISDFNKVMADKPRGDFKDHRLDLLSVEKSAMKVIKDLPFFTFESFEKKYLQGDFDSENLFGYFENKIRDLTEVDSLQTAEIYKNAQNSISNYFSKPKLTAHDVTPEFLRKYEMWMQRNSKSLTTTSMYLRCLRHIWNMASEENRYDPQLYPFNKNKYKIPQPRIIKKALTLEEIKRLYEYEAEKDSQEELYRDIWFFSYLCNGTNIKDVCMLKHANIQGKHIYLNREKTKYSDRNSKPIDVVIIDELQEIIDRWSTKMITSEDFLLPFLSKGQSVAQINATVKQVTKLTNKYVRRIAAKVGIDKNITTYSARHSYATVLKRSNASISFISESLGHKSLKTTEIYLDSFEDDTKMEAAKQLLNFNSVND